MVVPLVVGLGMALLLPLTAQDLVHSEECVLLPDATDLTAVHRWPVSDLVLGVFHLYNDNQENTIDDHLV